MQAHETAHQWWGDLVGWKSYRDQWLVEALASYSAILAYEKDRAADCKQSPATKVEEFFGLSAGVSSSIILS